MPDKAQEAIKEELTEDIGDPALAQHLYALVGFMRVRSDGGWKQFYSMVQKAFPKKGESLTLDFGEIEA